MDNNNKSKAFIITFIVVILLLLAGYFFFFKGKSSTEGTLANRVFAPLLGSSKQKDVTPINTPDNTNTSNDNTVIDGGDNVGSGGEQVTGTDTAAVVPKLNSIATPSNICKDKNGKVITCTLNKIDNVDINTTQVKKPVIKADLTPQEQCPEGNPVILTADEQKELDTLLADYYRIAGKLKTEADIYALNDAGVEYTDLINQAVSLTNDCEEEKADPAYTGPQEVKDNPYYQNPNSTGEESYLVDETNDPLTKLIENAIKYTPKTAFSNPILVGDPAYNNLDTFFLKYFDFENLFGIW